MADHPLVAELRRALNNELPEYMQDLTKAVPTDLVRQIADDFRNYSPTPRADPNAKVSVHGAGRVVDGETQRGTGWTEPAKVDSWRPPGVEHMDRMMDQQDQIDRAARIRELGGASAAQRALAQAAAEAEARDKAQEPKPAKEKGPKA
jgi:hypothetical protein